MTYTIEGHGTSIAYASGKRSANEAVLEARALIDEGLLHTVKITDSIGNSFNPEEFQMLLDRNW
jgi:hypothetical protein